MQDSKLTIKANGRIHIDTDMFMNPALAARECHSYWS